MAVVGDFEEGSCLLPCASVQCYSLESVSLPSVLIGARTPTWSIASKGLLRFALLWVVCYSALLCLRAQQDGVVLPVIGGDCVSNLCKQWCE